MRMRWVEWRKLIGNMMYLLLYVLEEESSYHLLNNNKLNDR